MYYGVAAVVGHPSARLGHVGGVSADFGGLGGVGLAGEASRLGGAAFIDHGDGHVAGDFGVIYRRVDEGVEEGEHEEEDEHSGVRQGAGGLAAEYSRRVDKPMLYVAEYVHCCYLSRV